MRPTLAVLYQSGMPSAFFADFAHALENERFTVHLEVRESQGPFAGIMWAMMTMGAVFIASNYFGGMLKELGKDHYLVLKEELAKLTQKTMSVPRIEPTLFGTPGKADNNDPYSMVFSVWAELPNNRSAKLLIPKVATANDYAAITDAFLEFVIRCHEHGEEVLAEIGFEISSRGNPITVAYNKSTGAIEFANPFLIDAIAGRLLM